MINYHPNLVSALNTVLPTYYEMVLTSKTKTPCISYLEMSNAATHLGDTLGYSRINYQIKIWGQDIEALQRYALEVDAVLRPLGFVRTSTGELYDNNSSMVQKIMNYEALAFEQF